MRFRALKEAQYENQPTYMYTTGTKARPN